MSLPRLFMSLNLWSPTVLCVLRRAVLQCCARADFATMSGECDSKEGSTQAVARGGPVPTPLPDAAPRRRAGAKIQRRKKRMVAFSPPRHPTMPTRHLHVANTGPAVGVAVEDVWEAFSAYGSLQRVMVELPQRAYLIVTYAHIEDAVAALVQRNRPKGAGCKVKVSVVAEHGSSTLATNDLRLRRITTCHSREALCLYKDVGCA